MIETKIIACVFFVLFILNFIAISIGVAHEDIKDCFHSSFDFNIAVWLIVSGSVGIVFWVARLCMNIFLLFMTDGEYVKNEGSEQPYIVQIIDGIFFAIYAMWLCIWFIFGAIVYDHNSTYCYQHLEHALEFSLAKIVLEFILMCCFCCYAPLNCYRASQD